MRGHILGQFDSPLYPTTKIRRGSAEDYLRVMQLMKVKNGAKRRRKAWAEIDWTKIRERLQKAGEDRSRKSQNLA